MARHLRVQVLGGRVRDDIEARTVKEAYEKLGLSGSHSVTVNGEPAEMDDELTDYEYVCFAPTVKGA